VKFSLFLTDLLVVVPRATEEVFFLTKQELRLPCQECLKATNVCIAMLPQQFSNDKVEQHPNLVGEHKFVYLFQSNNPSQRRRVVKGGAKKDWPKGVRGGGRCVYTRPSLQLVSMKFKLLIT
jgi:hypothetical protein